MTDLDRIKDEIDLAAQDPRARQALAQKLHRLQKLESVVREKRRRLEAIVTHWLSHQPTPVDMDPPAERGSSGDLVQESRRAA